MITGLKAWDTDIMPQRDRDYELGSDGVSGLLPGIYDIDVAYVKVGDQHSQVMNELEKNYIINLVKASYTLTGNVYTVTADRQIHMVQFQSSTSSLEMKTVTDSRLTVEQDSLRTQRSL